MHRCAYVPIACIYIPQAKILYEALTCWILASTTKQWCACRAIKWLVISMVRTEDTTIRGSMPISGSKQRPDDSRLHQCEYLPSYSLRLTALVSASQSIAWRVESNYEEMAFIRKNWKTLFHTVHSLLASFNMRHPTCQHACYPLHVYGFTEPWR